MPYFQNYPAAGNFPPYPGPFQQPTAFPGVQPQNAAFPASPELATVQTINQVEQVSLQPGQRRIVMVQNEPVIAARFADQMGLVTTEYYRLEKFDPAANTPAPEYVTRKEFEDFVSGLKEHHEEAKKK